MGSGTYGVQAASEKYFNKKVEDLNLYECAVIASLLKAPSRFNPIANKSLSKERASLVLENMVKDGMISKDKVKQAKFNNQKAKSNQNVKIKKQKSKSSQKSKIKNQQAKILAQVNICSRFA